MSELTDMITQTGAENVANIIKDDPNFRIFNLLWNDPKELIPVCNQMGFVTLTQLINWCNSVNVAIGNTVAFEDLIDPVVNYSLSSFNKTAWNNLHVSIHATGLLSNDCILHNNDAEYYLPTKIQWQEILSKCPAKEYKWKNEHLDCDDFVNIARGWLSAKGLGNTANAFVATRHYLNAVPTGGHAVLLVWDNTLTPWQFEPQNGLLYAVNYAKLGGNNLANRIEYARVFA